MTQNDIHTQPQSIPHVLAYGAKRLVLDHPVIMGILNLTPDSFYDGGKHNLSEEHIIQRVQEMINDGASIIDIGGASSKPGASLIDPVLEQQRILTSLKKIRERFPDIWLSVDTYHASTAKLSLEAGADIINDISAGSIDADMFEVIASFGCPYIIMHMKGTPAHMQQNPVYDEIIPELISFFQDKTRTLKKHGIMNLVIDPGFGFGKTVDHNFTLLKYLQLFGKVLHLPFLAGLSRKSMINQVLHTKPEAAL